MTISYGTAEVFTYIYTATTSGTSNFTFPCVTVTDTATSVFSAGWQPYQYPQNVGFYNVGNIYGYVGSYPQETPEAAAAREKLEKEYAEKAKKADHRARLLFIRVAGREAYKLLKKNGHYDVVGSSGQRYRLAVGYKVRVMDGNFGDKVLHQLCAYVPDVPAVDTLLAQYLALTSSVGSEEEFKKIAIKHAA